MGGVHSAAAPLQSPAMAELDDHVLIRKVMRRLIPFCILCYLLNYIDRVNISVAKLKMVVVSSACFPK